MTYIKPLSREEQAHCRRTAALSELLAKLAGLPDSEVRTVTQSALVHDIGKTAIPPAILGKTGPLTEEEHAIMRMHTAIGAHILIHTHGAMRTASAVALQHHERLDGSGYLGLRGNEIHPHAKLVAVADVFDWACAGMRSIPMRSWSRLPMSLTPCFRPAPISGRGAFGVPAITSPASPA